MGTWLTWIGWISAVLVSSEPVIGCPVVWLPSPGVVSRISAGACSLELASVDVWEMGVIVTRSASELPPALGTGVTITGLGLVSAVNRIYNSKL